MNKRKAQLKVKQASQNEEKEKRAVIIEVRKEMKLSLIKSNEIF
jgi:hypothetical protein